MKNCNKLRLLLLYLLPTALFLSYHPHIKVTTLPFMYIELSVTLIWLALFSLLSIPFLPESFKSLMRHFSVKIRPFFLLVFSLTAIFITFSVMTSPSRLRGLLTLIVLICLAISILTIPKLISSQKIKTKIIKLIILNGAFFAAICFLQCLLDLFGINRDITLLCQGCTYRTFGFPHPNGFAVEPQFMGNLLLAPALLSLLLISNQKLRQNFFSRQDNFSKSLPILTIFLIITLFLTFSRGAIYAFLLAVFALIILSIAKKHHQPLQSNLKIIISVTLLSFVVSLLFQGIFSALSPTNDTFQSGITKSLHQLSLGKIDLRNIPQHPAKTKTPSKPSSNLAPSHDGYIAESTNIRLKLSECGLDLWDDSPKNLLFGVGLGGAGQALYRKNPNFPGTPKEIIQNEFVSILVELGLLGAILILLCFSLIFYLFAKLSHLYIFIFILAYAATLGFFSGLPNALHIYLIPALLFGAFASSSKNPKSLCGKN